METVLFQRLFFHDSTSQDKKLLLMLPFLESQWRHTRVVSGVCLSVFARASLHSFLSVWANPLPTKIKNVSHVWTNSCLQPLLLADIVSWPMTQHYDSGDSQISNPSTPSLTLYQLSYCATYVHYFCKYDVVGASVPFFSLDETQEQHIGHCENARLMLGRAFALFLASQWGVF